MHPGSQEIKEIGGLDQCVHLEKLWIIENEVREIKGLSKLHKLRELYLYSNRITQIKNLEELTNLEVRRLPLAPLLLVLRLWSAGRLHHTRAPRHAAPRCVRCATRDQGGGAARPQVLSLANNSITSLEGLGSLEKLRELNLARNDILLIGDRLASNTSLEVLNLADNSIGSFKVRGRARAPWGA